MNKQKIKILYSIIMMLIGAYCLQQYNENNGLRIIADLLQLILCVLCFNIMTQEN